MSSLLKWNGRDLPASLRSLPPGDYVVERVDEPPQLTAEEDAGLEAALRSLRSGDRREIADVRARLAALLHR